MQVMLSTADNETAQRVRVALGPFCREMARHHEQSQCTLMLAPGVLVAEFIARDGTRAKVPVGVAPLAAATVSGTVAIQKYVDQMMRWASDKQERERIRHSVGLISPS